MKYFVAVVIAAVVLAASLAAPPNQGSGSGSPQWGGSPGNSSDSDESGSHHSNNSSHEHGHHSNHSSHEHGHHNGSHECNDSREGSDSGDCSHSRENRPIFLAFQQEALRQLSCVYNSIENVTDSHRVRRLNHHTRHDLNSTLNRLFRCRHEDSQHELDRCVTRQSHKFWDILNRYYRNLFAANRFDVFGRIQHRLVRCVARRGHHDRDHHDHHDNHNNHNHHNNHTNHNDHDHSYDDSHDDNWSA